MSHALDYNQHTRLKYQDTGYAIHYKEEYSGRITLKNFGAKIIASRERRIVLNICERIGFISRVLDIPCGTGKMAKILASRALSIWAADISKEMMELAKRDYCKFRHFQGFIRTDACNMPFMSGFFDCVFCIRLLDRVPPQIRKNMLSEFARVSKKYVVVSYGLTSGLQRIRLFLREHLLNDISVPYPAKLYQMLEEIRSTNLHLMKMYHVFPFLSSEVILWLKKK